MRHPRRYDSAAIVPGALESGAIGRLGLGIDIAVDLKGYTQWARPGIFRHGPAPVTVNWLGYPGTMAVDWYDYILADPVVLPHDRQPFHDEKIVLKQLPTFAVMDKKYNTSEEQLPIYLSAGAIINPDILNAEVERHGMVVFLNNNAVLIRPEDVLAEGSGAIAAVAGTRQGVGAALARKVWRYPDAVVSSYEGAWHPNIQFTDGAAFDWAKMTAFVEVSQGFSLGLHSQFYPKVTSRECTAAQALAAGDVGT